VAVEIPTSSLVGAAVVNWGGGSSGGGERDVSMSSLCVVIPDCDSWIGSRSSSPQRAAG